MLKRLSGKTHTVITALAVIDSETQKVALGYEETRVKMKKMKAADIAAYVKSGAPLDKAGGYGIQEVKEIFIDCISGDYDNVVGLPVEKLKQILRAFR